MDIDEVRSYRCSASRGLQSRHAFQYQRIEVDASLSEKHAKLNPEMGPSPRAQIRYHLPQEEIALGPACWLVRTRYPAQPTTLLTRPPVGLFAQI